MNAILLPPAPPSIGAAFLADSTWAAAQAVGAIIARRDLHPLFQPIMDFRVRAIVGYEGLIRGPAGSPLYTPAALFSAAKSAGMAADLEHACREATLRAFARLDLPGKLFLNVTPCCLADERLLNGVTHKLLASLGIAPSRIVIELTENQQITKMPEILGLLSLYRERGFQIAIDDLGEGFANLRMWSEVRPEYVKIDRHFIDGIARDRLKYHFVRAMQDLAKISASQLVAEGIEAEDDFSLLRDMGIACGQGYFVARPAADPGRALCTSVMESLGGDRVALSPIGAIGGKPVTAEALLRPIVPVTPADDNDWIIERFESDLGLEVLPVVREGLPIGLINRHTILDGFTRPFRRELFGRRSCTQFMNPTPMIVDRNATVQEIGLMLARTDKQHLIDGFIISADGAYLGVGSSHDLMALITEMQISAARYANPLTHLPGNVPINEHIDRLLEVRADFAACYVDIDNFKPYNDTFGYRHGDDVIQLVGRVLLEVADPRLDFVGHIGGDDFFVLFQSDDWEERSQAMVDRFAAAMAGVVGEEECRQGGFTAENRRGEQTFYKLPSLSVGALRVEAGSYDSHREVAAAASAAKKLAKKHGGGQVFVERRRPQLVRAG